MSQRCAVRLIAGLFVVSAVVVPARAQSNTVPGQDVKLQAMGSLKALGREGTFPDGVNGVAIATTACNPGSVKIPWFAPMNTDHPFISPILARELGDRFEQISDRSYIKHGFFATNLNDCGTCQYPGSGAYLGLNCSDTYSTTNNGDNYYLGPPDEVDPWLGTWDKFCSQFDRGEPPVAPPFDCDGKRSLTENMAENLGPVGHRIHVLDQDFNESTATYYFQGQYVIEGEAESLRENNTGSRRFIPSWNGSRWNLSVPSSNNALMYGSVLQRWTGATVASTTNGGDDGRVFVAVKVTGPDRGLFHYYYAVHNRDNMRGVSTFRIPVCASARVQNVHFRDVDQDPSNDWTMVKSATEIAFETTDNPILWNSFYNFSFDSDAAPLASTIVMDQFRSGTGAPFLSLSSSAPLEVDNLYVGDGCGLPNAPVLFATGNPNKASLGNPTFGLGVEDCEPLSLSYLLASVSPATLPLNSSCNLYMSASGILLLGIFPADANGAIAIPAPIPNDPSLEGLTVIVQTIDVVSNGAVWGQYNVSNGLAVRIGTAVPPCP